MTNYALILEKNRKNWSHLKLLYIEARVADFLYLKLGTDMTNEICNFLCHKIIYYPIS